MIEINLKTMQRMHEQIIAILQPPTIRFEDYLANMERYGILSENELKLFWTIESGRHCIGNFNDR